MKKPLFALLALIIVASTATTGNHMASSGESVSSMLASVFFVQSTTSVELQKKFNEVPKTNHRTKILIMPGHEPNFGGTEYQDLKERDMTVDLARDLAQYLSTNSRYEVIVARDKDGWNPMLEEYFRTHEEDIRAFTLLHKEEMARLEQQGKIVRATNGVDHNDAPRDVALRLFGINKWANEHGVDITLHIHFNDYARRALTRPGDYNGFTIYTPDRQYSNAEASSEVAAYLFRRLSYFSPVSNLHKEDEGLVYDQDLIAVGQSNTSDGASMVLEYGYIYEPQFSTPALRAATLKELAFQTYLGLADFFGDKTREAGPYRTTLLPTKFDTPLQKGSEPKKEVLELQAALANQGLYPPPDTTRNDCPMNGVFGICTQTAVKAFQEKFRIRGISSFVGDQTRAKLNELYGTK
jgi:N-acetylmuramoyl-L-alanine amidase